MRLVDLRGREHEPSVAALLGAAQIHRTLEEAIERGPRIATEYAESPNLDLWGVEHTGKLIAVAGVEHRGGESVLQLNDLAVDAVWRGGGVGRRIVMSLRDRSPGAVITGVTLEPAAWFYAALGFEVTPDGAMPSGQPRLRFTWTPPDLRSHRASSPTPREVPSTRTTTRKNATA